MRSAVVLVIAFLLTPAVVALSPPTMPLAVAAATGLSPGEIDLTWSPPASEGASPVAGYRIYRSLTPTGLSHYVDLGNVLSFTDTGIADGAPRYYRVSAVNGDGEGPLSAPVNASAMAAPSAPRNPAAGPDGRGNISLTWSEPQFNGTLDVLSYVVYRTPDNATVPFAYHASPTSTSFVDTGLADNVSFVYRVSAVNALGEGAFSINVSGNSPGVPYPPPNMTISSFPLLGVTIGWSTPYEGGDPIDWYRVHRAVGSGPMKFHVRLQEFQRSYTDFDCPVVTTCTYQVLAQNDVGMGDLGQALTARGSELALS